MDLIGCINFAKDFVVAGTASSNLYGICESLFEEKMVRILLCVTVAVHICRNLNIYSKSSRNVSWMPLIATPSVAGALKLPSCNMIINWIIDIIYLFA